MFDTVQMAPADPILGLSEAFVKDTNPNKINLSVGVYKDAKGQTPVLACVLEAEKRLLASEKSKGYKPIEGAPEYAQAVQRMLFGESHEIVTSGRAVSAHSPGGTGALRNVGEYLRVNHPGATLWMSDPTWANHPAIFKAAGISVKTYPYYDARTHSLALGPMIEGLKQVPAGDVVLLHACCHNPTGADPTIEQWKAIAQVIAQRKLLPLVDFAYQGFGEGLEEDAAGLRELARHAREMLICSSFSKNFGLYNERVGALTIVADAPDAAERVLSQVKVCIRANYSNPPAHGGAIVTTILADAALRTQWLGELQQMRDRINGMRQLFTDTLAKKGITLPGGDNSFITRQMGMFSFSGLTKEHVERLRKDFAIYIVGSGRINVAGMTESNMDRLCEAIGAVMASAK